MWKLFVLFFLLPPSLSASLLRDPARRSSLRDVLTAKIAELEKSAESKSSSENRVLKSRLYYYLSLTEEDEKSQRDLCRKGVLLAEDVLEEKPGFAAALYWKIAHEGQLASTSGAFAALSMLKDIERDLMRLRGLDPKLEHGGADRGLSAIYDAAPNVISIGSRSKADYHLDEAMAIAPEYPGNLLLEGRRALRRGNPDLARAIAEKVQRRKELKGEELDVPFWREQAAELLESAGKP